ncbi:MAG: hypothetical protein LBP59_01785 [Planctomycetaceae bacterium]|jgi:hypothetical protein|nr:hypothetical protein [Planctomycetaceae bacterium]
MKSKLYFVGFFAVLFGAILLFTNSAQAQINIRIGGRPHHHNDYRHHPHHYSHGRHYNDFDRTVRVLGAVGSIVAAANGYSPYDYRPRRPVIVVPPQPVVVTQPASPVIVEKPVVVEKQVIVEKQVPVVMPANNDYYSPKLGAAFVIQNMQIPGYTFKAARLTSTPIAGSPLNAIGLVKGDVITRLDNESADSLETLEKHEANTVVRYIKSGTTKVLLGKIYIPKNITTDVSDVIYAP